MRDDPALVVAAEWVSKAENDFKAAGHLLKIERDNPTDTVCFHAQQCVEKYLKALLIWRGKVRSAARECLPKSTLRSKGS